MSMTRQKQFYFFIAAFFLSSVILIGQTKNDGKYLGKAELYKAKKNALEFLSDSMIISRFGVISDSIWSYSELGMQEFRSSAILIKTLEQEGFVVEKNVAGIPTCFIATWGSGKPVIGILGEYDALPMLSQKPLTPWKAPIVDGAPGHGCGHNTMGTAGVAAMIAIKKSMELNGIKGTIRFFGSPAEETLIGRPFMVKAGVFNDIDAVIDNHASADFSTRYGVLGSAVMSIVFSFRGKAAHSAGSPWSGRSALDAVELMNVSTNYLREHLFYTNRMHYVITEGGETPNVVPDKASVWYYLRNTDEMLEDMFKRVVDCARGAALASGTTLDTVNVITAIHQRHLNRGLAEIIQKNIELIGMPEWTEKENLFAKSLQKELGEKETGYPAKTGTLSEPPSIQVGGSSSDVGEVTLLAPTATVNFPTGVPGSIGHHWSTVTSGYGTAAWKGLNAGAKVIAATALDLLTEPRLLNEIRKEFLEYSRNHPYKSFLPDGARPPLELNRELMEKYRKATITSGSNY
jgi:aminobenzoyl-glutamate utilization protein B